MRSVPLMVAVLIYFTLVSDLPAAKPKATKRPTIPTAPRETVAGLIIGDPITHGNLTIFPVSSKAPRSDDRFITLDEAVKAGTVEIHERGAAAVGGRGGNSVNQLMVINNSNRPLYLMPGEIIIGGSQDRAIATELVVAPDKKPVPLAVFCVEHGRWGKRDDAEYARIVSETGANSARASSVAIGGGNSAPRSAEANQGKFIGSVGSLSRSGRVAVQKGEGQQKVWDEVGKENAKAGVKAQSGTFTGNYSEPEAVKRLDLYMENLLEPVQKTENVVGVIVAVNGKVESMDVFEATPLFRKLWPKLLKSYSLDAANAPKKSGSQICTIRQAKAFLEDVSNASAKKTSNSGNLAVTQGESERVLLFTAHEAKSQRRGAAAAPSQGLGGGMGGMGGSFGGGGFGGVHGSAFAR